MRRVAITTLIVTLWSIGACALPRDENPWASDGPVVGHVDETSARIWLRAPDPSVELTIEMWGLDGKVEHEDVGDRSRVAHITGLKPGTTYTYHTVFDSSVSVKNSFTTAPPKDADEARLAFVSCVNDHKFKRQPAWKTLAGHDPDALVLLGDTPYIDTTSLKTQRRRYRKFWSLNDAREVFATTPTWATWDDHDFGKNDTDGRLRGKEDSRRAFVEHHAHAEFGTGTEGIYTSFRWGPVEVFLIDARWWANTGPSPIDPRKKTLLGKEQWDWIRKKLEASTAPFKVLTTGMIWNGAVRPFKRDHWLTWKHERDALWRFVGDKKIPGVVLMGGDIHRSRALKHAAEDRAGYPLYEFITSPMANSIIEAANVKHPGLLHDAAEEHTFMLMDVTKTTLRIRCLNHENTELFAVAVEASELR